MRYTIILFILVAVIANVEASIRITNTTTSCGFIADPNISINRSPLARPVFNSRIIDPDFGGCITRITDYETLGTNSTVPTYSQLQAWNADMSMILLVSNQIINATNYQLVHGIDWGWPDWGEAVRWSPTDPHVLYYSDNDNSFCSGAALMRYTLIPGQPMTRNRSLVRCFPEYEWFFKDAIHEEMSEDGRYIALMGRKPAANAWGWVAEAFAYDIINDTKHGTVELPIDLTWGPRTCDHIQMSPSGTYVILQCAGGTNRFYGMEAFDLEMNYLGKVHTGSGHGDLAWDEDGSEWNVVTNANNAYLFSGNHYIVKARIPDGYTAYMAGDTNASQRILMLDWFTGMHISCQGQQSGFCVVSASGDISDGVLPFEQEIFKIYLDSSYTSPHVERYVDPRSNGTHVYDNCAISSYWAQPHGTVARDASKVMFGSSWGENCFVESYIIDIACTSYHDADTNHDGNVNTSELKGYILAWKDGSATLSSLTTAMQQWKNK